MLVPMTTTKPIRPTEVAGRKKQTIPDRVIEVFNQLITENYSHGHAKVMQNDVVDRLVDQGDTRDELFHKGWLDVEELFQSFGWHVDYDKPGYNEEYDAFFIFRKK